MKLRFLITIFVLIKSGSSYVENVGPTIMPTCGDIWPKPIKEDRKENEYVQINPSNFVFLVEDLDCDILKEAKYRYENLIKEILNYTVQPCDGKSSDENSNKIPKLEISNISLILTSECEKYPYLNMNEHYTINLQENEITSSSVWGILRGLESFSQLIIPDNNYMLKIQVNIVDDYPKFPHRGVLVDTSRHYIKVNTLKEILDGMAYSKLNVFHWHIVDDQAFPYVSKKYPELAEKGAYFPHMVYTQENVADIIEYARLRGIRVLPEFDVPSHTRSWGESHPEILTKCSGFYEGELGPLNPIKEETKTFLSSFFEEISEVFADNYIHIGSDELEYECWSSNEEIKEYVKKHQTSLTHLFESITTDTANLVNTFNKTAIVWQEALQYNVDLELPKNTIIQVWKQDWTAVVRKITQRNWTVILSSCWYLDFLNTGGDWKKLYECDPLSFSESPELHKFLIGGEACMWAESVNSNNIVSRIFPRACAAAEKLWSNTNDIENAAHRLEEHTCRLSNRGVSAQPPNSAGFC